MIGGKKPPINDDDQMRVNVIVCVCNTCNTMLHELDSMETVQQY